MNKIFPLTIERTNEIMSANNIDLRYIVEEVIATEIYFNDNFRNFLSFELLYSNPEAFKPILRDVINRNDYSKEELVKLFTKTNDIRGLLLIGKDVNVYEHEQTLREIFKTKLFWNDAIKNGIFGYSFLEKYKDLINFDLLISTIFTREIKNKEFLDFSPFLNNRLLLRYKLDTDRLSYEELLEFEKEISDNILFWKKITRFLFKNNLQFSKFALNHIDKLIYDEKILRLIEIDGNFINTYLLEANEDYRGQLEMAIIKLAPNDILIQYATCFTKNITTYKKFAIQEIEEILKMGIEPNYFYQLKRRTEQFNGDTDECKDVIAPIKEFVVAFKEWFEKNPIPASTVEVFIKCGDFYWMVENSYNFTLNQSLAGKFALYFTENTKGRTKEFYRSLEMFDKKILQKVFPAFLKHNGLFTDNEVIEIFEYLSKKELLNSFELRDFISFVYRPSLYFYLRTKYKQ